MTDEPDSLGPYAAGEHRFSVEVHGPLRTRLRYALAPLSTTGLARTRYSVDPTGPDSFTVRWGTETLASAVAAETALQALLWHVNQAMVNLDDSRHLLLHAAAADLDGRVVVLAGRSGSGKSTSVAALAQDGLGYLTDEVVVLSREDLRVHPYRRAMSLDTAALDALNVTTPRPATGKAHVPWWEIGDSAPPQGHRPVLILFPTFESSGSTEAVRLTPGQTVLELARHTFRFSRSPVANLLALARLVQGSHAATLRFAHHTDLVTWVRTHLPASGSASSAWSRQGDPRLVEFSAGALVYVGEEAVIYNHQDGSLHRLDMAALRVWQGLATGQRPDEVAVALVEEAGATHDRTLAEIAAVVAHLERWSITPSALQTQV